MFRHHRRMRRFTAFCVPIILSLHIALGACFEPVSLIVPLTLYGFSYKQFLLSHTNSPFEWIHISMYCAFRPVRSQVRQSFYGHSHHSYFIDPRHIGNISHLWDTFHSIICLGYSLPTSPSFWPWHHCQRQSEYQGERFWALLLHSTHSNYQFS